MAQISLGTPTATGVLGIPSMPHGAQASSGSDTDTFDRPAMVYVGTTGDVTVTPYGQTTTVQFVAVPAGTVLPVAIRQLWALGTTAGELVLVY